MKTVSSLQLKPGYWNETLKLTNKHLLPETGKCPICGSAGRKRVLKIQDSPDIFLEECLKCKAVSASRMPSKKTLASYYGSYYEGEAHEKATIENKMGLPRKFAKHILKEYKGRNAGGTFEILDFGGGDGILAKEAGALLLEQGCKNVKITVVDMSRTKCVNEDKRIQVLAYDRIEKIKGKKFDLVLASAVIEHIPNPLYELGKLFDAVKPGGMFYARTPFSVPLMKLCSKFNVKIDMGYPGHVHDLGREFWENVINLVRGGDKYGIIKSQPSMVGSTFRVHPFLTVIAYAMKFPWYFLGKYYDLVGGWEIFIMRKMKAAKQKYNSK